MSYDQELANAEAALRDCRAQLEAMTRERNRLEREIRNAAGQTIDEMCRDALLRAVGERK